MLVHSFGTASESLADFQTFVEVLGGKAAVDHMIGLGDRNGVELFVGWVTGDEGFLLA